MFSSISLEKWQEKVIKELKKSNADPFLWRENIEGLRVKALYTSADVLLGSSTPLPKTQWLKCQYHNALELTKVRSDMDNDCAADMEGYWLHLDSAVRLNGAFKGDGLLLWHSAGFSTLFSNLPTIPKYIRFDGGENGLVMAAAFQGWATHNDQKTDDWCFNWCVDPIGSLAKEGKLSRGIESSYDEGAKLLEWVQQYQPKSKVFCIDIEPYHMAGLDLVSELACMLSVLVETFERLSKYGHTQSEIAKYCSIAVPIDRNFFIGVVKLRAIRRLWAVLCGVYEVANVTPHIHAVTSRRMYSRRDPWVNMLRGTSSGYASVIGGADVVTILPFDHRLANSALGKRVARNTHLILQQECNIGSVSDPMAGSYYIESLTENLCQQVWRAFQDMESKQGILSLLINNELQKMAKQQSAIRTEKFSTHVPITGVNRYPPLQKKSFDKAMNHDEVVAAEKDSLRQYCETRGGEVNLTSRNADTLGAFFAQGATVFEMITQLKNQTCLAAVPLQEKFDSDPFEHRFMQSIDKSPKVLLVGIGKTVDWNSRAGFVKNFLAVGGIDSHLVTDLEDPADIIAQAKSSDVKCVCICSSDDTYQRIGNMLVEALEVKSGLLTIFVGRKIENLNPWMVLNTSTPILDSLDKILAEV